MWVQYNLTTAVMGAAVIVEMPASLKHSLQCQGMGHISGMSFQSAAVWLCTLATRPKVSADLHVCTHIDEHVTAMLRFPQNHYYTLHLYWLVYINGQLVSHSVCTPLN